jgi:hypothetical protein
VNTHVLTLNATIRFRSYALLTAVVVMTSHGLYAQTYTSSNPGNFGIDGDLYSDTVLNGSFTAAASHDWFYKAGGGGIAVFDTTGTALAKEKINSGANYGFTKKMQFAQYSTQGGYLFLDGAYNRDYIGNGSMLDKTAFNTSNTNTSAMNPAGWTTMPLGSSSIPGKVDILDTYIHMRRLSSTTNHVIAYVGASTVASNGNRYFDFEFYKSKIGYDSASGIFVNSGPSVTGGHSAWSFTPDGSISSFGDLTLSFSFSSTAVSSIDLYIWVAYTTYSSFTPAAFDFTPNSWVGLSNNSGYGYAQIQAKSGTTLQAWGMVNTSLVSGPPWAGSYAAGSFAEAAIDLTSIGIDPLIALSTDPCAPPYTRILIKSRSSSSFSSALQDFVGPIIFLPNAPSATIGQASRLTCTQNIQVLQPAIYSSGATYTWSTSNGNFLSRTDSGYISINKPGTYYLSAHIGNCSSTTIDSVIIPGDIYKPVASADYTGALVPGYPYQITLRGGDAIASNYTTPFGGSAGLLWNWSGPYGFSSSLQNPSASDTGFYVLTVTEKRNGCTAISSVRVRYETPLPVRIINMQGTYDDARQQTILHWEIINNDVSQVFPQVERSTDGLHFRLTGNRAVKNGNSYRYADTPAFTTLYYRVRLKTKAGYVYGPVIQLHSKLDVASAVAHINNSGQIVIEYKIPVKEQLSIHIIDNSGKTLGQFQQQVHEGNNMLTLPIIMLSKGVYFVKIGDKRNFTVLKLVN